MKLEHGIIISVGVLVCISLVLIANNPSEMVSYSGLEKLNQDAKDAKASENQDLLDQNRLKMKKHLEAITSSALGINIDSIYLKEDWNFPFRDSSEVKHTREEYENNPVCNILPNLSLHLQSIRQTELFQMYGKKYQNYFIELDIADERYDNSTVHYGFSAKSGNNHASTHFHVDSCTGQTSDYLYLRCHDLGIGNGTGSNYRNEVITSLQSDEFCEIVLEPWRAKLAKYNEKISNDVHAYLEKIQQDSNDPDDMIPITKDLHRLNQLSDMVRLAMDGNHNDAEFSEKMKKYELRYGSVPDEFLELLGEIENEN
jgi:hypothetical protein